ncbi:hypothetical protein PRZ48_008970 [Zasmidium cellare]|uniref:Uncharacterized protein n=1 Tax=Zasmidium cellare TaxID=395010 RepID=A0ABR0EGZ5_ZASCE|nr:hypothetical protein PRZ48_008970 [Zasmidium cellare]
MLAARPIRKLQSARTFHTSSTQRASVLFALGALSNSRETQHFNKLSHLSRVEHSPPLKLIKTGEVDPFPLPTSAKPTPTVQNVSRTRSAAKIWDGKALKAGRAILADNARQVARLSRALERSKRRQSKADMAMQRSLADWAKERQKMHGEIRQAGVWILAAVGTATGLAMWRFWPQGEVGRDSGELGRKIAARARESIPLPAMSAGAGAAHGGEVLAAPVAQAVTRPVPAQVLARSVPVEQTTSQGSWWQNLFWKPH